MSTAVVSAASMSTTVKAATPVSTTVTLRKGWRWTNNDQNHSQYKNQSQSCRFHNSPLSNKMLLQMQRSCCEICLEVAVKVLEKRSQKEDGARRSMWGEEGNDVRPYQVKGW
jgi:hypothetical protein